MAQAQKRPDALTAAFKAGALHYAEMGSPLYAALCDAGADDPEIVALVSNAMAGSQPVFHLLASVHHLLMANPKDSLARYFATLSDGPLPPEGAFPDFARFCRAHRAEILDMLAHRTVQTTYVERCVSVVAPLAYVADTVGEPLHLIEIGCSAGVLLTFDKYAYEFKGRGRIGDANAPLTLSGDISGPAPLRLARIASRTGIDLYPVNAKSEDERRWIVAQTFPEFRAQRARLSTALDVVAATDIAMHGGDGLAVLPRVLAATPDPVCVFHSACLYYWSEEAKAALDVLLTEASRGRVIHRVGIEASANYNAWHKGQGEGEEKRGPAGEITVVRYANGVMEKRVVADTYVEGPIEWRA